MSSATTTQPWITLAEVWQAYRKAKKEAFYNNTVAHGLRFAAFERNLEDNLTALHKMLLDEQHLWATNVKLIGQISYVPKSLDSFDSNENEPHFIESEPLAEWRRVAKGRRVEAETRLVIEATVEYQIIATLWSLKVGEKYERSLLTPGVYANRLRRRYRQEAEDEVIEHGPVNWDSHSLFQSFVYQYGRWRRDGIRASRKDLEAGHRVVGIALDVSSFYDCIDAKFLLNASFLKRMGVQLSKSERALTRALIVSFETWREQASRDCGIPIGLQCSGLIANLLLGPFDRAVVDRLKPTFYGRFVDDIYISIQTDRSFKDGSTLLNWLVRKMPWLKLDAGVIALRLPYAATSKVRFGSKKQRVFQLAKQAGLDVISAIEEHMRERSSAHRMLPDLPKSESKLRENSLMLSHDAGVATAVFREADFVSLKKAGFAEGLSKMYRIAEVLSPEEWTEDRKVFYDVAARHLLAPKGFFEFYAYVPRVVGLMATCSDWDELREFLEGLAKLKLTLRRTTNLSSQEIAAMFRNLASRVQLAALRCCHDISDPELEQSVLALQEVRKIGHLINKGVTKERIRAYATELHSCDWGRVPYFVSHLESKRRKSRLSLPVEVRTQLHFSEVQDALNQMKVAQLTPETWRAFIFPTRYITMSAITSRLTWEQVVGVSNRRNNRLDPNQFSRWVLALRGIRLHREYKPEALIHANKAVGIAVGSKESKPIRLAVSNVLTTDEEWLAAAKGIPSLNRDRFVRLTEMINKVIMHDPLPDTLVMPELSLPRSLLDPFVEGLGRSSVNLVAGLEYRRSNGKLLNQAVVTLDLGRGYGQILLYQTKNSPSWEEAKLLKRKAATSLESPRSPILPVYRTDGFYFGLLICSDLTNPHFRSHYQGLVDGLFALEWNQDTVTFNSLVESSALDIHAYIIQANNRQFGDGRIRAPLKATYARDVIQLKGGVHDYFVVGEIDPRELRVVQSNPTPKVGGKAKFKPFPIGFQLAPWRRVKS